MGLSRFALDFFGGQKKPYRNYVPIRSKKKTTIPKFTSTFSILLEKTVDQNCLFHFFHDSCTIRLFSQKKLLKFRKALLKLYRYLLTCWCICQSLKGWLKQKWSRMVFGITHFSTLFLCCLVWLRFQKKKLRELTQ